MDVDLGKVRQATLLPPQTMVVGAGRMGTDIAFKIACAAAEQNGRVFLVDSSGSSLRAAQDRFFELIGKALERAGKPGGIDSSTAARLREAGSISFTARISDGAKAGLIIEAVPDVLATKQAVLADVVRVVQAGALLATNTSYLGADDVFANLPAEFRKYALAMHFFWPAHINPVVEVAPIEGTEVAALARALGIVDRMGKIALEISKARPGLALNVLLSALFVSCCRVVEQGLATASQADAICGELFGFRPFALSDKNKGNRVKIDGYPTLAQSVSSWFGPPELLLAKGDGAWDVAEGADLSDVDVAQVQRQLVGMFFYWAFELSQKAGLVKQTALLAALPKAFAMRPVVEVVAYFGAGNIARAVHECAAAAELPAPGDAISTWLGAI